MKDAPHPGGMSSDTRGDLLAQQPPQPGRPRPCRGHARGKGQAFTAPFPLHLLERAPPKDVRD